MKRGVMLFLATLIIFSYGCVKPVPELGGGIQEEGKQPEDITNPIEKIEEDAKYAVDQETRTDKKNAEEKSDKPELSFDLSIADANPLDFDPAGPFYHKIIKASSDDGLSFKGKEEVFKHASVPDSLRLEGDRIALYAVDGYGRSKSGLMVAFSFDGSSWESGSVQLESDAGHGGAADPEVVLLPDGKIRLFYVIFPPENENNEVWSAISEDGIHFIEEEGIRFKYPRLTDPDIAKIGDSWYMYFAQGPRLVAASSPDGNLFTLEKTIRERGSVSNTVPVSDGKWRQFYCNEGIKTALSSDGLNWKDESGTIIAAEPGTIVCDPAPIKIGEGWMLFYKVGPLPNKK